MSRPVRIGGKSMTQEEFFENYLMPGWDSFKVFEKTLKHYVGRSCFGSFDENLRVPFSCFFKSTAKGCRKDNCKYSHEAPDGVLCVASPPRATEEEQERNLRQARVALYVQLKRQVAKYRLKGVAIPSDLTFEEIVNDVPFGRLLSVETPAGIFDEARTRKGEKRKQIADAGITSEDEIAELMQLCPYDLEHALSTRTTPEANAAGGGPTTPATVPIGPTGRSYADKASAGTTLVKAPKKGGETPYADKVKGKDTGASIKAPIPVILPAPAAEEDTPLAHDVPEVNLAKRIVALEATVGTMSTTIADMANTIRGLKKMLEGATIAGGGPLLGGIAERVAALEEGIKGRTSPALSAVSAEFEGKNWADVAGEA